MNSDDGKAKMLGALKKFFNEAIAPQGEEALQHRLKLATAALMVEMMQQDDEVHEAEVQAVKAALKERFELKDEETEALFELAHTEARGLTDYYQFTSLINKHFSLEQKIQVVEYLWQIAYADARLDRYEEHMVRRVAELIYVPHHEFIKAKHRVLGE